jgi:hypothetical protein
MDQGGPDIAACRRMFRDFGRHSASTAPLYATLAAGIADDPELAAFLLLAPPEQRQPVLLFACVHWLVIHEPDSELGRHYPNLHRHAPNHGGPNLHRGPKAAGDPVAAWRRFCDAHRDQLTELLATRRTQTNEIGRAALLLPPFGLLADDVGPLAHVDVGASAGLNLLTPEFDYSYVPGGTVAKGSAVVLSCGTRGDPPVPARHPEIAAAIGLDASPLDVGDPAQARWLEACVWPDQVERFERLAAAIEIANEVGVEVRQGDAAGDVAAVIADAAASGHPVVTTTWVLNYLSADRRRQFVDALDVAGATRDLSWVYAENPVLCAELPGAPRRSPGGDEPTALVLVRWRHGERTAVHLADAHPHGRWMHWISSTPI